MKFGINKLDLLCVLCASVVNCFALDREAFTFTNYDLNVRVEPEQHRLGVRGKITLRNDTATPQKIAVLQISSSLDWRSIKAGDKPVQFVSQPYTSDIDHTGALSEAIVTLPEAVAPKATVELEIAYEGVILLDATRLTRIGTPEDVAQSSDWDQIAPSFTALRGAGYVAWYPIATEVANLSEGDRLFEVLGRWKAREAGWKMSLHVDLRLPGQNPLPTILLNRYQCTVASSHEDELEYVLAGCTYQGFGLEDPVMVIAPYQKLGRPASMDIRFLRGHDGSAADYAKEAEKVLPLITEWFGAPHERVRIADLADPDCTSFETGLMLFVALANSNPDRISLQSAHQLTHAAFFSPQPWIHEGLAHFAQALYLEHEKGRQAALDYMGLHRSAFLEAEKQITPAKPEDELNHALVNTTNEELYRSKAMYVWWMLRDMMGDAALKKALASYRTEQDTELSSMPHLVMAQTQRDLQWFF